MTWSRIAAFSIGMVGIFGGLCSEAQGQANLTLTASDSTQVAIHRDSFGVPHIVAETEVGVFFGQGFVAAQDRLYQMEINRRTAEGRMAEWIPGMVTADSITRRVMYTAQERTQKFNSWGAVYQAAFQSYSDGINEFIDSMTANPSAYRPWEFETNGWSMDPWTPENSLAIGQFNLRRLGGFGCQELVRLGELEANGQAWFDSLRAINDTGLITTIPDGVAAPEHTWNYSGLRVRADVSQTMGRRRQIWDSLLHSVGVPKKFGSFCALTTPAKSGSGHVMLYGAPQMMGPGDVFENTVNVIHEVELDCPSLHAQGNSFAGFPGIIMGRNEQLAWTITSGFSDNCDLYIDSTRDTTFDEYWHDGQWLTLDVIDDTIEVSGGGPVVFTHYRTIHGPVVDADLPIHQLISTKITFWDDETSTMEAFIDMSRATNLVTFEAAVQKISVSFNLFYAGIDQTIKFWHAGRYQDRTDGVDPRLPHKGDGTEEWGGIIPFDSLPSDMDPAQGFYVNWNNKPASWWNNGDVGWWPCCVGRAVGVAALDDYVRPLTPFSYTDLRNVPYAIGRFGTYQQSQDISADSFTVAHNLVAPGQSGFIDMANQKSSHWSDQWPLHLASDTKEMIFGRYCLDPVDPDADGIGTSCDNCPEVFNFDQGTTITMNGDVNLSTTLTSADIIYLVNYVFKSQAAPLPCDASGDVNCSGSVTSADIIYMVNHVFKGDPPPCDICQAMGLGWSCP
jgi:penicillin amidase